MPGSRKTAAHAGRSLRVLVAEDNEVNQALAARLLANQGHDAVVVSNGREAVAAWEQGGFDLILMDVQMPHMDGIAATAAIRQRESGTAKRTPIVALTADTLPADETRCREAGMDAFMSKPVRVEAFYEVIARVLGGSARYAPAAAGAHEEPAADGGFDIERALEAVGGERDLFTGMIGIFLRQTPRILDDIDRALASADGAALETAAHKLKGSVAMFAAQAARDAAQRLEDLGESGELDFAPEARARLGREIARLQAALAAFAPEQSP